MNLIGQFSRQSALWQKRIPGSEDEFGEPQYELPETIKCRCVRQSKAHLDSMGAVVVSDYLVMCEAGVEIGDKLTAGGVEMKRISQSKYLQKIVEDERSKFIDLAESRLVAAVQNGNLTAVLFTLKTLGRPRGFNEHPRDDFSGPGGIPIEPPSITIHFVTG
jgi:hypothetical protein